MSDAEYRVAMNDAEYRVAMNDAEYRVAMNDAGYRVAMNDAEYRVDLTEAVGPARLSWMKTAVPRRPAGRLCLLLFCALALCAAPGAFAASVQIDPLSDGIIVGTSVVLAGLSELALPLLPPIRTLGAADVSTVDALDRALLYPYSPTLDTTSTVLEISSALIPGLLAFFVPSSELVPIGVVYVESLAFAVAAKNTLKYLLPRYRPYVYEGGAPGVSASDDTQSFPSGHATFAFAAASAGVALFAIYQPDSPWFWPFTAASYGVATITAGLRVAAGMHFLTDVVAGAALGTVCGLLPPLLHVKKAPGAPSSALSVDVGAGGVIVRYAY